METTTTQRKYKRPWTKREDNRLLAKFEHMAYAELANSLGRSEGAIKTRLCQVFKVRKFDEWTREDDQYVRMQRKHHVTFPEIAVHLGRTSDAVRNRAKLLGLERRPVHITNEIASKIRRLYHVLGNEEIAKRLDVEVHVVKQLLFIEGRKRTSLELEKIRAKRKHWLNLYQGA